jgi:nucleoside-diphosphate-sugar epimerase
MEILLTGADGFTGAHFAQKVKCKGHRIVPLRSNLTNKDALRLEIAKKQFDAVVHLAAISFVGHEDESAFYNVNVVGTTNLLSALASLKQRPNKVLLASSANVYGNCEDSPISELQEPAPANHYAMSKMAMELMARAYFDELPIVIARPFNYTGVGQVSTFIIPKLVEHFVRKASCVSLGNVNVEREFNDVRTICDAYLGLIEHGQSGETYNICTGNAFTLHDVINYLETLTGHSIDISVNPDFVRPNEVIRLCGDPSKLHRALSAVQTTLFNPALIQTLEWMLRDYENGSKQIANDI